MHIERQVLVGIGSNLGDSVQNVRDALEKLRTKFRHSCGSSLYRSKPVGCAPGAPDYVNACATFRTILSPEALLRELRQLESSAGRPSTRARNEDRTLDVDIIAIEGVTLNSEALTVPHPRAHTRAFVLVPAVEIAPRFKLGDQTVREAHAALPETAVTELWPVDGDGSESDLSAAEAPL